jgi:hypothetical protein
LTPAAVDQGTATLVAAIIAAVASSLASLLALLPRLRAWRRSRKVRRRFVQMLSDGEPIRSFEWLTRNLGVSEADLRAMFPDIKAHGALMKGHIEGAALDSRHKGQ